MRKEIRLGNVNFEVVKVGASTIGGEREITITYEEGLDWEAVLKASIKAFRNMDSDWLRPDDEVKFKIDDNHDAIVGKDWITIRSAERVWSMQITYSEIDDIMLEFSAPFSRIHVHVEPESHAERIHRPESRSFGKVREFHVGMRMKKIHCIPYPVIVDELPEIPAGINVYGP